MNQALKLAIQVTVFVTLFPIAYADKDLLSEFDNARVEISIKEKTQREVMGALFGINQRIQSTAKKRSQLNQQLLESDAQVRTLAQDVGEMETKVVVQRDALNNHLRQLYQGRKIDSLQWLFSAKSPNQLERHFRFLKKFLKMDHALLKQYAETLATLSERKTAMQAKVKTLAQLQKSVSLQERVLAQEQLQKSKFLRSIREDKTHRLALLKELRKQHADLDDIIEYAFFEKRGSLHPPVDAPATRGFGTYVDPEFQFRLTHKGVFYSLAKGSSVRAIAPGKVSYAERLRGYGRLVIVDHGDNYFSAYAHNSSLKVSAGQVIKANETIATSGGSSPLFGPGLYFELRHFSDAIDPRPWFKDSLIKTASIDGAGDKEELQ